VRQHRVGESMTCHRKFLTRPLVYIRQEGRKVGRQEGRLADHMDHHTSDGVKRQARRHATGG
jgi:hypothetical protein